MLEVRTFTPSSLSEALRKCKITADEKQLLRVYGTLQDIQLADSNRNEKQLRGKLRDTETGQLLNITAKADENLSNFDECVLEGRLVDWVPLTKNTKRLCTESAEVCCRLKVLIQNEIIILAV